MARSSDDTRRALLDATYRVIRNNGAAHLTLDAIAQAAGVSKGGLLYHFPSKQALLRGLVDDELERLTAQLSEATRAEGADQPGSLTRAWVQHGFASLMEEILNFNVNSGALAVVAEDPQLLKPAREWFGELNERLQNDHIDPVLATIVRLAVDGISLGALLGFPPPTEPLRSQVRDALLALTRCGKTIRELVGQIEPIENEGQVGD
jgi:AcrR family transcriptional regulator